MKYEKIFMRWVSSFRRVLVSRRSDWKGMLQMSVIGEVERGTSDKGLSVSVTRFGYCLSMIV